MMDSGFVTVRGLRIFRVTAGAGTPVLYLHGNTGSSRWFSRVMDIPGCRTIAPDMPNFGASSPMEGAVDIRAYADIAKAFMDESGLKDAVVVGHSLGGAVAQSLALRHPDAVRALVLVDSSPPSGLVTPKERYPFIEMMRKDRSILSRALAATTPTLKDAALFESLVDDATRMAEKAWTGNADALGSCDMSGMAASFAKPVLVIQGRMDSIVTEAMARETAAAYPDSRLAFAENVGHAIIVENPEMFRDFLLRFVEDIAR